MSFVDCGEGVSGGQGHKQRIPHSAAHEVPFPSSLAVKKLMGVPKPALNGVDVVPQQLVALQCTPSLRHMTQASVKCSAPNSHQ